MEKLGINRPIQLFGTDIDDYAIATARAAHYPASMTGMSPERIERWFVRHGDGYCPIKKIREMCIFSVHSVIRDPPFSKLDLIACRNLMIYLDAGLQDRVVRSFHYALNPGGVLFLGPSESLPRGSKLFGVLDKRHRVFERRATDRPARLPEFSAVEIRTELPRLTSQQSVATMGDDLLDRHVRSVLENYSPAYVIIDKQCEVLRFSGGAIGHYLEPSRGAPSLNVFSLLRKTLRPVVRAAVKKVFVEGQTYLQQQISIKIGGESHLLRVVAAPINPGRNEPGLCVIALQDLGTVSPKKGKRAHAATGTSVALEQELQVAKAQIVVLASDLDTANEQAASSAEEYQSVNEELQSSNEELETAKEEMQSINEELQTVNAELNSKNEQLMRSNSDLQNLLDSTEIATVFLDADLRVKGFTPAMTELFHLREGDRGRPLDEIASRMAYGDLRKDVLAVLHEMKTIERELEISNRGLTFIMRIRPYRTVENIVDGVVITFIDISSRKKLEEALREHAAIVEFSQDALFHLTPDGIIRSWNPGAKKLFGYSALEAIGKPITFLDAAGRVDEQCALLEKARSGEVAGPVDTIRLRQGGRNVDVELTIVPIRGDGAVVAALAVSARNIAERNAADIQRTLLLRELSHRVKNTLASVQAIAKQTLKATSTHEDFVRSFSARLMALAKTHDLLTQGEWQAASLRDVICAELMPYENDSNERWSCVGPDIQLDAKTALALGMAIHELATNAAKHGALSTVGGHIRITWDSHDDGGIARLHLAWIERGGPPVQAPKRKGFGTRLIGEGLAHELNGDVKLAFDAAGVRCVIDVPLNQQAAVA